MHAIARTVADVPPNDGITTIETEKMLLVSFQTLTGTKFFVTAEAGATGVEHVLQTVYRLYADYVLKNPFYEIEMPIRCQLFTQEINSMIERHFGQ